jgi:hypothetical protein
MDYLTNHYKFKAEQLQERYEFLKYQLKIITEARNDSKAADAGEPSETWGAREIRLEKLYNKFKNVNDAQFAEWLKASGLDNESMEILERSRKAGKFDAKGASSNSSSAPKTETPKAETPPKTETPKAEPSSASKTETPKAPNSGPTPPPRRDPYAERNAEARRRADQRASRSAAEAEARAAKGETAKPASEVKAKKPAGPSKFITFVKGQFPTLTKPSTVPGALKREIVGGVKHMFTPAGLAGLGAGYVADKALDVAADVTGVETLKNPWVKTPTSWAAMNAVDTAVGQGARALGTRAGLAAVGGSAVSGALLGAAAYGGYKAGEALSDVELPFQGEGKRATVSDALGKGIYYAARSPFNWIAGNATGAGTSDLNEKPKGVAGGDAAMLARNAAADEEEKQKAKERAEWIANRAKQLQGQSEND